MNVNLSSNARTGLTVLRNVADQMATTQSRLVTGKAVNSPLDNVSKFFTASSMDTRAASIDSLMDNINAAQSSMKAASEGIKGIQGLIKEARGLTSQALTSTAPENAKVTGNKAAMTNATLVDATVASGGLGMAVGETVAVNDGTTTVTYTVTAGDDVSDMLTALNAGTTLKVTAALDESGKLSFTADEAKIDVTLSGTGIAKAGHAAATTKWEENATRKALATQFDALRSEIDRIAKDSGINGSNLLGGDKITLALNEDGSSSTTVQGTAVSASSLNVAASTAEWQNDTAVNDALKSLIGAASSLEATAASFSSNQSIINARKEFNSSLSDILKSSASNLTAADMDQEAANLVALQTRQQMATTALSIMQSSETTALSLLR